MALASHTTYCLILSIFSHLLNSETLPRSAQKPLYSKVCDYNKFPLFYGLLLGLPAFPIPQGIIKEPDRLKSSSPHFSTELGKNL